MIEKELKVLLSKEEYHKIDELFTWEQCFEQKNYYYKEKKDVSVKNNNTIRIREKKDKYYLQVKVPIKLQGSLHIKKEFEQEIEKIYNCIKAKRLKELTNIDLQDSYLIGCLTTERKVCNQYSDVEICLDKSCYFNKWDYELEIEYKNEYPNNIVSLISDIGIKVNEEIKGKYSRFLNEYLDNLK